MCVVFKLIRFHQDKKIQFNVKKHFVWYWDNILKLYSLCIKILNVLGSRWGNNIQYIIFVLKDSSFLSYQLIILSFASIQHFSQKHYIVEFLHSFILSEGDFKILCSKLNHNLLSYCECCGTALIHCWGQIQKSTCTNGRLFSISKLHTDHNLSHYIQLKNVIKFFFKQKEKS